MTEYPADAVRRHLDDALSKTRRPKRLSTRAQRAIDAIADFLEHVESDQIDDGDRVALEDARAALDGYTRAD